MRVIGRLSSGSGGRAKLHLRYTQNKYKPCGQNVELSCDKHGGAESNHWTLKR